MMEFRAGRVLGQAVGIFARNLVGFVVLGLVVYAPILVHNGWIVAPDDFFEVTARANGHSVFWRLLEAVIDLMFQATVVYSVFLQMRGDRPSIVAAVGAGLGRLFPVLGVVILLVLAIVGAALPGFLLGGMTDAPVVGVLAIAIPAGYVYVVFYVAIPAAVVERPGIMMSLRRSQELTEGNRWGIFGLLLVTVVLAFVIAFLLQRAFLGDAFDLTVAKLRTFTAIESVVDLVFGIFGAVVVAVAYHDLRMAKDGVSADELAAVFE